MKELGKVNAALVPFVQKNKYGDESIDFANPSAVKALNQALLKAFYDISFWDIPAGYLCPPIPGRADYIHSAADLFTRKNDLVVLDIGTGANCIYPLIGQKEYHWRFVGADIDPVSVRNGTDIVEKNQLTSHIEVRLQPDAQKIFENIVLPHEKFDLVICNPPFHESLAMARKGTNRKWQKLGKKQVKEPLNFGGQGAELWTPGGERSFIQQMIHESAQFHTQVKWFTSLVSKEENLLPLRKYSESKKVKEFRVIPMEQGNKKSRLIAWNF